MNEGLTGVERHEEIQGVSHITRCLTLPHSPLQVKLQYQTGPHGDDAESAHTRAVRWIVHPESHSDDCRGTSRRRRIGRRGRRKMPKEPLAFTLTLLTDLPAHYKPWMDIARNVTELISSHSLRLRIHDMPLLETHLLQTHRELRLAHLALSTMTMGYVWQEGERETVKVLPRNLSVPFCEVSRRLGLPPILIHADTVLANWKKRDPDGPFSVENLELLLTLPGGESVRGFFLVTLLVELAAVPGLKSILDVINGVHYNDVAMVTKALDVVSQAIDSMKQALKLMHEYVDPSIFYGILRIYLSGWKDNPSMPEGLVYEGVQEKPMEFSGGSAAQSSILHCFDELLGVQHKGDGVTTVMIMLDNMGSSCFAQTCRVRASDTVINEPVAK